MVFAFQCTKPDGTITAWNGIVFPPPKYKHFNSLSMKRIQSSSEGGVSTAWKNITRNREGLRNTKETVVTSAPQITKQFLSAMSLFHDFQENQETLEDMISLMTREGGTKEDVQK